MGKKILDTLRIELILNTRRVNRKLDLVEVSEMMHKLRQSLNSIKEVSKEISLSEEMVRQFLTIRSLPKEIKKLLKKRKIDSVDVAYRLSLLDSYNNQTVLASKFVNDELTSKDLREIVALKRRKPKMKLEKIIREFEDIRDVRRYNILLSDEKISWLLAIPSEKEAVKLIKNKFEEKLGLNSITEMNVKETIIIIVLTEKGYRKLTKMATENKMSKRDAILKILSY